MLFLSIVLLAIGLYGCTMPDIDKNNEVIPPEEITIIDPNWPVTVSETEIKAAPEHVFCLSPALTEYIYDIGLIDRVSFITEECNFISSSALPDTAGTMFSPDYEKLSAISGGYALFFGEPNEDVLINLQQKNLKIVSFKFPKTIEELKSLFKDLFLFFDGKKDGIENGLEYCERYDSLLSEITRESEKKSAAFIRYLDTTYVTLDCLGGQILSLAFDNVSGECTDYLVPLDTIKTIQPDAIFLSGRFRIKDLESNDLYKKKTAVKNDKVFLSDLDTISLGTIRSIQIIKDMMATVYDDYSDGSALEPAYPSLYS